MVWSWSYIFYQCFMLLHFDSPLCKQLEYFWCFISIQRYPYSHKVMLNCFHSWHIFLLFIRKANMLPAINLGKSFPKIMNTYVDWNSGFPGALAFNLIVSCVIFFYCSIATDVSKGLCPGMRVDVVGWNWEKDDNENSSEEDDKNSSTLIIEM